MLMFLKGATYPLELLSDATTLAKEAKKHVSEDGRTTPLERAFSRSTIFTAFNFLESLLIELTQECLRLPSVNSVAKSEIENALRDAKASISWTIKDWPVMLGKKPVHGLAEFGCFNKLRQLRNNLTHPKLDPIQPTELTQDQLLQAANATNAAWVVSEVKKMGKALYQAFGVSIPPEVL